MKDIVICIPSFKRPIVETLKYIPSAEVYVAKSQLEEYKEKNPKANFVAVDDKYQGNVCRIRNFIMDFNKGKICCIVDDDLQYLGYWEKNLLNKLETEAEIYSMIEKFSILAMDLGVHFWGLNVNKDKQVYREMQPFSTLAYIGSPFMVHIDQDLRFDERFSLKEDYDFTLQNLNKYRKVLRVNKYHYYVRQKEQVGGVADYRTLDEEKSQLKLLQQKWGDKIVREDKLVNGKGRKSAKNRSFDINPILSIPIAGI
jgi:hypothetical protein